MVHAKKGTRRIIIVSLLTAVPGSSIREIPMVKKNPVPEGRAPFDPGACRGEGGHVTSRWGSPEYQRTFVRISIAMMVQIVLPTKIKENL